MSQSLVSPMVLALAIGMTITTTVCSGSDWLGRALGVMAFPDDIRRLHKNATPQTGGLAILSGLFAAVLALALTTPRGDAHLAGAILAACGVVGTVGFWDDRAEIGPNLRLILLFGALGFALWLDPELVSPHLNWRLLGPIGISPWGFIPLIGLAAVGIVCAVNMADGQDGVAGSMFVTWFLCLTIVGTREIRQIAALSCVLCAIVLLFNLRGRLFLGDCGSFGVTFAVGLLVSLAHARRELSLETVIVWFFVPVADCLRLLVTRLHRGTSPFTGDRDHVHHRLEALAGKSGGLLVYVAVVAGTSIAATVDPHLDVPCIAVVSLLYGGFIWGAPAIRILGKFLAAPEKIGAPPQELKSLQLRQNISRIRD